MEAKKSKSFLKKFYAVTDSSSLYKAVIGVSKTCPYPYIKKIALKGESKVRVGQVISNGTMLAICDTLIMFIPEGGGFTSFERQISGVNTRYWGGGTSKIVALFKEEKDARFCLNNHIKNNQKYEQKWRQKTIETLRAIGN